MPTPLRSVFKLIGRPSAACNSTRKETPTTLGGGTNHKKKKKLRAQPFPGGHGFRELAESYITDTRTRDRNQKVQTERGHRFPEAVV